MQPDTSDASYLWDMLDAACAIQEFLGDKTFDDYTNNRMLRGAVERHIEIIGEAAYQIPQDVREDVTAIPWDDIIGMRHRLVHAYFDINLDILWQTVNSDLPPLITALENLLDSYS